MDNANQDNGHQDTAADESKNVFEDMNAHEEDGAENVAQEEIGINDGDGVLDPALQNESDHNDSKAIGREDLHSIPSYKISDEGGVRDVSVKKNIRKAAPISPLGGDVVEGNTALVDENQTQPESNYIEEDPHLRRRRLLEEKMDRAIKAKTTRRRKADEDDLERMQDDRIDALKDKMIKAANLDVEKNSEGQIATEKLKLLKEVSDVLSKADLAISILDNNLLEAVRLWLEPLPDASMPAYQIQKELINALTTLPIKTDHLVASGIGKVLVFYQRSKRTEPNLRKIVDRLIGDWTRPILNKSDSYKDRTIQFHEYNKTKFSNQLSSARRHRPKESKTLYEESAERRKRAAIPSARTTAYKIAPKVDTDSLRRQMYRNNNGANDERFRRLNQKLTSMNIKKKANKKNGPSIEGRNLAL